MHFASMIEIIPMFKQKYGIEKLSFITLTDGCQIVAKVFFMKIIDYNGDKTMLTNPY